MSLSRLSSLDRRTVALLDGLVVFWVVLWAVVAAWSAYEVWQLAELSTTTAESGQALDRAGRAFENLEPVPIVGDDSARLGGELRRTAADIVLSAREAGQGTRRLSVLLGLSVFCLPLTPVVGFYAPLRLSWARGRREVARALRQRPAHRSLDAYLARQAVAHLPFQVLRDVSPDPFSDIDSGRYDRLADAELARLGLRRPTRPGAD